MIKKRVFIGLAALAAIAVSGCGGSGSFHLQPPASGVLNFSGAAPTPFTSTTASPAVPATGGATISIGGGATAVVPSGAVPAGTVLPAGTVYAIIPIGTGFAGTLNGLGQLTINGVANSGALVGASTSLTTVNVALPVSAAGIFYSISFPSSTLTTDRALNVGSIIVNGKFYYKGGVVFTTIPKELQGTLPANGQNAAGASVVGMYSTAAPYNTASVTINYGHGTDFVLFQTQPAIAKIPLSGPLKGQKSLVFQFTDFTTDSSNVPNPGGVDSVIISLQ